jgi:hypothetical protein
MKQESINSIQEELTQYVEDSRNDFDFESEDLHHHLFNEDYYIIGYHKASEWLKKHNVDAFEGIAFVQDYENFNFGEARTYDNAETLVNMIVYIIGEDVVNLIQEEV